MTKRPLSIAIIAWFLGIFSLIGLYGVVTMGSNPAMAKMVEQSNMSLQFLQIWGAIRLRKGSRAFDSCRSHRSGHPSRCRPSRRHQCTGRARSSG